MGREIGSRPTARTVFRRALIETALEAVKQWRYQPTLLNGMVRPVIFMVTLSVQP